MLNFEHLSYWEKNEYLKEVDFVLIGAGIVACSSAYHLRLKYPNARILILERGYLPSGASTKNAGFACFGSATELLSDLEKNSPGEVFQTVDMRWQGLQYLREIIGDENLDFQGLGSWDVLKTNEDWVFQDTHDKIHFLNEEVRKITGQDTVYAWDDDLENKFGFQGVLGGFTNRLEGQIDTGKMMNAWHRKLVAMDVRFLYGIEVKSLEDASDAVYLQTNKGEFKAGQVLVCVNGFAKQFLPTEDVEPARAQVLITKPIENLKVKGTFHYQEGYYYFRNIHNRILLGGGRNLDFKGENTTDLQNTELIQSALQTLLKEMIAPNQNIEIEGFWSGVMGVGASKRPIVKKVSKRVAVGVRMGGMGVAIGSLVGKELVELV